MVDMNALLALQGQLFLLMALGAFSAAGGFWTAASKRD